MAVIPWKVYSKVEWHLHNRAGLVSSAMNAYFKAQQAAEAYQSPTTSEGSHGKGQHGDPTAKKAVALVAASQEVERARRWGLVCDKAFAHFEGTKTGEIALAYYGQKVTILELADTMQIDRQTIRNYRDKFVCVCALYAAEQGLIRMEEGGDEA